MKFLYIYRLRTYQSVIIKNIVRDVINELEHCNYELIGIDGNQTKIKPNWEQKIWEDLIVHNWLIT